MTYEITNTTNYPKTENAIGGKAVSVKITGSYTVFDLDRIQEETGADVLEF